MKDGYETVKEVLADMKKRSENANGIANDNPDATTHCDAVAVMLDNLRHRIESAHQHEIDELTAAEHGGVIVNGAVRGLKAENELLRGALKRIADMSFGDRLEDPYNTDVRHIHDVALESLGVEL